MNKIKIVILGSSGMLGHTLFSELSKSSKFEVYGTVRNNIILRRYLTNSNYHRIIENIDAFKTDMLEESLLVAGE